MVFLVSCITENPLVWRRCRGSSAATVGDAARYTMPYVHHEDSSKAHILNPLAHTLNHEAHQRSVQTARDVAHVHRLL